MKVGAVAAGEGGIVLVGRGDVVPPGESPESVLLAEVDRGLVPQPSVGLGRISEERGAERIEFQGLVFDGRWRRP